ncbi:YidC/Oxa1 family membrane protein insertase [Saccharibacillus sacchari]|uniref:YidC/Oxa1 family membrane protein insertase n=1 Tax=Saccharibacillus sacchari TaxID=456493 RepID=A0ACC6PDI3_9BACL
MSHLFKRRGKWVMVIAAVLLIAVLAGCTPATTLHTTEDLKNSGSFWQSNVVYWFALALDSFARWFGGEYGLAVLLLVLIVRTLILPLTIKSVKSSKAMQAIQPEMQKLREQYKDDPQRMQQEQMRLFQENKVNPAAGCLPLIIQMPIFIALYNAIIYNSDLAQHSFLWMELGKPDIPLTLFAAATTFLQTWLMMRQNPAQQQGPMKFMLFVYPVLIFFMGYQFPSALPLYWAMSNVYTIVQNYFLYRNKDAKAAAVIAQQGGAKPAGKNGTSGGGVSLSKGAGPVSSRKKKKKKR